MLLSGEAKFIFESVRTGQRYLVGGNILRFYVFTSPFLFNIMFSIFYLFLFLLGGFCTPKKDTAPRSVRPALTEANKDGEKWYLDKEIASGGQVSLRS